MPRSLRIYTENALLTRTATVTGVDSQSNISQYSRRNFALCTSTVTSVSSAFDSAAATGSNKYNINFSFATPLQKLFGLSIGPNTLSLAGGAVVAIRINSTASGVAGFYKGAQVLYNTIFDLPIVLSGQATPLSEGWYPYSQNYVESAGRVKAYKFSHPGIPILFDSEILNVSSIDVFITQAGYLEKSLTFQEFNPQYLYTVGLSEANIPDEFWDNAPTGTDPIVVDSSTDLAIAYATVFDESEVVSESIGLYGGLDDLRENPGKGLGISNDSSSSVSKSGGYLTLKTPGRTRLGIKLPIPLTTRQTTSRLQYLMRKGSPVYIALFESEDMTNGSMMREVDLSRLVRIMSPVQISSPRDGLFDVELTLEEV